MFTNGTRPLGSCISTLVLEPLQSVSENIQTNYVNCDLCKADDGETVLEKLGGIYVKCRQCGFVYTRPLFDVDDVNTAYFTDTKQRYIDTSYGSRKQKAYTRALRRFDQYRKTNNLLEIGSNVGGAFPAPVRWAGTPLVSNLL